MRVHHLSCGTLCPVSKRFMQGEGSFFEPAELVCHCLLIETEAGLVLVDTGFGTGDVERPGCSRRMRMISRPKARYETTALAQLQALGFSPSDVRHIVVTHLDFDHAGGLADFPNARVHLFRAELEAAERRNVRMGTARYCPSQWAFGALFETYDVCSEPWFGFPAVRDLRGLPPEILLIPLPGHTPGHCGVAVELDDGSFLLHAGDAYFWHDEMKPDGPRCPPGLVAYQTLMQTDRDPRLANQRRLRELVRTHGAKPTSARGRGDVRVFCAHDPHELRALQQASAGRPAARPPEERPRPQPSA